MSGGFIAELMNLFMLSSRTSVADCITFFVAFHILNAIDNIYAEGIADFELREAVELRLFYKNGPIPASFLFIFVFPHYIIQ